MVRPFPKRREQGRQALVQQCCAEEREIYSSKTDQYLAERYTVITGPCQHCEAPMLPRPTETHQLSRAFPLASSTDGLDLVTSHSTGFAVGAPFS